ncbi:MAG: PilT/PilU family type 4a pilus ATPase [Deltaproteobacteria bacterium]|nr:PilT/PilU family type 4a pilus ATPase [Deltaproteobacteria bacterium]
MAELHALFKILKDVGGSDLHLSVGLPPRIRCDGALVDVEGRSVLGQDDLLVLLREVVSEAQWEEYTRTGDLDFAYGLKGVARFRANYLRQLKGAAAVFRIIPEKILSVEELGMPPAVGGLADLHRGLVLITGPTGSGKSTTLAAIIDRINSRYRKHIVTIEDPVEFIHPNKQSVLSQREVGTDAESFAAALRVALRQDADVVLVGEMRDLETISLAITAAEMGALVFGTLHTNSAAKTIDRIIDAFPAKEQAKIRTTLSESVTGIVSQLLLPKIGGGRIAAHEILLRTSGLPNVVREGSNAMLRSIIQGGRAIGMTTMDDSLMQLVKNGQVSAREGYRKAENRSAFEPLMKKEQAAQVSS